MYSVTKGMYIDFAHSVIGHPGACINLHGHTWLFQVTAKSQELNGIGFVTDFKDIKTQILQPIHDLLDHSYATSEAIFEKIEAPLVMIGRVMKGTIDEDASLATVKRLKPQQRLCEARTPDIYLKTAVFPFNPTSERLAKWLYDVAIFADIKGLTIESARVYETLHPVKSFAEYKR